MKTWSIIEYIESIHDKTNIKELTINRFDIAGDIIPVDMNDLKNFNTLEKLTICNMTLSEEDMIIISSLNNLKSLELYNCEFTLNDLGLYINNMSLDNLLLDNTYINFDYINKTINKIIIRNMKLEKYIACNELDIHAADAKIENLDIEKYKKIIINNNQYLTYKNMLSDLIGVTSIVIMSELTEMIEAQYE